MGADHIPQILVWNKIDAEELAPAAERDEYDKIQQVFISVKKGIGLDFLRQTFVEFVTQNPGLPNYLIPVAWIEEQHIK